MRNESFDDNRADEDREAVHPYADTWNPGLHSRPNDVVCRSDPRYDSIL